MKIYKKGKWLAGLSVALLLLILVAAVFLIIRHTNDGREDNGMAAAQTAVNNPVTVTLSPTVASIGNEIAPSVTPAAVSGSDMGDYELYSLDFIDENCGWAIRHDYNRAAQPDISKVIRTQDGGITWTEYEVNNAILKKLVFADEENGWAIALEGSGPESDGEAVIYEVLCTHDGGESWQVQLQQKASFSGNYDMGCYDKMNSFVIIEGMMFVTGDSGNTWSKIKFPVENFYPQYLSFSSADTGWVTGTVTKTVRKKDGTIGSEAYTLYVLHTTDEGEDWQTQFQETYSEGPVEPLAVNFIDQETGWFLTCDYATNGGDLYHTTDGGQSWEKINHMTCNRPSPKELEFISSLVGWIPLWMGAGPIDGGILYTADGGKHFNEITRGGYVYDVGSIIYNVDSVEFVSEREGFAAVIDFSAGAYIAHTTGDYVWKKVYPE